MFSSVVLKQMVAFGVLLYYSSYLFSPNPTEFTPKVKPSSNPYADKTQIKLGNQGGTNGEEELEAKTMASPTSAYEEIQGVKIWRDPPESTLSELGVSSWKKWAGEPCKIPWTFDSGSEKMYLLKGKVKVYRHRDDGGKGNEEQEETPFEIGAGDLVEFPAGMKIVWEVIEAVEKHYCLFP